MDRRTAAALSIALAAATAAAHPGPPPAGGGFNDTASVLSVEVPVTVVRGGEPVRGLTAADFELYDGKRKQQITGFDVVDLGAPAKGGAVPAEAPIAGRRHFLLLFDLSFSEPPALVRARQAASSFVARGTYPSDLVAVATYSTSEGPRLALGFTSDRRQMEEAIATLGVPQLGERNPDQLGLLVSPKAETGGRSPFQTQQKKYDSMVLEHLQSLARSEGRATRQTAKNDVGAMTRSLADLARLMASVEGRKYVVYLSQGFDSGLLRGTTDREAVADAHEQAASSLDRLEVDSSLRFGDTKTGTEIRRLLDELRRADCVVESVDIGGLRAEADQAASRTSGEDTLFLLARDTGGELFKNTNDLAGSMADLLKRTSVTYVLSFQPAEPGAAGQYHELRVRLRDERAAGGARVVYRPGYYAPRPYLARSPLERQLATAGLLLGGAPGGRIATAVLAAALPAAAGSQAAAVPVVVEIDGPALLAGATDTAQADVYVYALDGEGAIRDHFAQVIELDLGKVRGTLARGGVKLYGQLALAPGSYVLRVLVQSGVTGETGLRAVPLAVPAFDRGEPALLPPLVPDPPGRWLNLRASGGGAAPFPFTAGGRPFLPAARPVVAAGGEAPLVLLAAGLGEGDPRHLALSGRVLGADGKPRPEGAVALRGGAAPADGVERLEAAFQPGGLPAGDYTLVVTLTDPATRRAASSSIPFAIQPAAGATRP